LRLLASVSVGRVGLSIKALPAVLPVNFALLDGEVVFRTVEGTKFHAAAAGRVLAFEADGYETDGLSGWSVLVQGVSRVVTCYRRDYLRTTVGAPARIFGDDFSLGD
jgi:nitroimidazol reductase NimA-like FMN-containing flavoprotein (pyridoxamine 5'-phosphate oxidase superfamily)